MIKINKKLTPYNYTAMSNKKNEYIVIHYVGAVSTAADNATYFANNRLKSSAHYFVDSNSIWQSVEDSNSSWHCGGGLQSSNGHTYYGVCKNSNSIGIEMCCFKDSTGRWFFATETVNNTIELVRYLMDKYNIPIKNVIRHYDVTGKNCPAPYVNETEWAKFKQSIVTVAPTSTELTEINDIVWELANNGIITNKELWLDKLKTDTNAYWLARKTVKRIGELKYK